MTFTAPVLDAPAAEALAWLAGARRRARPSWRPRPFVVPVRIRTA